MKERLKNAFGIKENKYHFEANDIRAIVNVLNVISVMCFGLIAAWIGLAINTVELCLDTMHETHLNVYIMHIAFVILNMYFLGIFYGTI